MSKIKLAVIFGGMSSEHEVSRVSSKAIIDNLDKDKYEIYKVGITKDGRWFWTDAPTDEIADGSWENRENNIPASISPDRSVKGLMTPDGTIPLDVVLLGVHGRNCEDGVLQGLLECSGIPYTGSGVTASACSMDKSVTKLMVDKAGIRQADFVLIYRHENEYEGGMDNILNKVESHFDSSYPLFVKPSNEGSSVGITKAHDRDELEQAILLAFQYDRKVLVEETITGREIETAVLGNESPVVAKPGEVFAANEFYDYEAKYNNIGSETVILEDLEPEVEAMIKDTAVRVFKAMGCRGYARIDFFLTEDNEIILNELNTLPGFTSISMYPQMWQATGMEYSDLLDKLIELACEE